MSETAATATERCRILRFFGATKAQRDELLHHLGDVARRVEQIWTVFPLPDEPYVETWFGYVEDGKVRGALAVLREVFVQLRFPIVSGISGTEAYRAATRRGAWDVSSGEPGARFRSPTGFRIALQESLAGRVPVITVDDRYDFVTLVRALTCRNEPAPIPASMGACAIASYNNWNRISSLHQAWRERNPHAPADLWQAEFRRLIPKKHLYQDEFIVLSRGPYSGVPIDRLGIEVADPLTFATTIRREHEIAHLFCRRVWGSMRTAILDEIVADFVGIRSAAGTFRSDWMLGFFGIERSGRLRSGARIRNYIGKAPLSPGAIRVLIRLVAAAATNLERFSSVIGTEANSDDWKLDALLTLPCNPLETLAAEPPERWLRA